MTLELKSRISGTPSEPWLTFSKFVGANKNTFLLLFLYSPQIPSELRHLYSDSIQMIICVFQYSTTSDHFFTNCMFIFYKTEVQTVILRCLKSLNLNWYDSYDTKRKSAKNANQCFCTKLQKNENGNICILCHNL